MQETSLSILYIYQARKFLRDSSLLHRSYSSSSALTPTAPSPRPGGKNPDHNHNRTSDTNQVLYHLIYTNLLIIALDATLLGIQCADLFYLQGAFKPCVYGVKLKVEFVILNRLIKSLRSHSISGPGSGNNAYNSNGSHPLPGSGPSPGLGPAANPNYYASASARPKPSGRSNSGGGFWTRHSRTRSGGGGGGGPGGPGGEEEGDQVWLSPLERGKGSRSRSQESQSPILERGIGGIDDLPLPNNEAGTRR